MKREAKVDPNDLLLGKIMDLCPGNCLPLVNKVCRDCVESWDVQAGVPMRDARLLLAETLRIAEYHEKMALPANVAVAIYDCSRRLPDGAR